MAKSDDKKRPLGERIAGLDPKTSFRDIRDGIGSGGAPELTDQDLAAALGMVKTKLGALPVMALETYYGSALRFEQRLCDAWGDKDEHGDMSRDARILSRFSAVIAVRQFAGLKQVDVEMARYAYLMFSKPAEFRRAVDNVLAWLEELRAEAERELRKKCSEPRAPLDSQKTAA
jgi:hypothetical protein